MVLRAGKHATRVLMKIAGKSTGIKGGKTDNPHLNDKRGKNMRPVLRVGKHAIGKIRYSGKGGKTGKPNLQLLRVCL